MAKQNKTKVANTLPEQAKSEPGILEDILQAVNDIIFEPLEDAAKHAKAVSADSPEESENDAPEVKQNESSNGSAGQSININLGRYFRTTKPARPDAVAASKGASSGEQE